MTESTFLDQELLEASRYRLVIQWSDEDNLFLVSLPELGGIRTHATSVVGAAERGVELAAEWIHAMRTLGRPIPTPSPVSAVA